MCPNNRLSPQQFITGMTVTLVFWFALYAWLLYGVFKVNLTWVVLIMGQVGIIMILAAIYGYRIWTLQNVPLVQRVRPTSRSGLGQTVLFMWAVAALGWTAVYLMWRGAHGAALFVGLATAGVALYGVLRLAVFRQFREPHGLDSEPLVPGIVQGFRAFMIAAAAAWVIGVTVVLLADGYVWTAGPALAATLLSVPWLVRKIKRELHHR
jgi:hypothetical protein